MNFNSLLFILLKYPICLIVLLLHSKESTAANFVLLEK